MIKCFMASFMSISLMLGLEASAGAEHMRLAIMQDNQGEARKYAPLIEYFKIKGIDTSFVGAPNYPAAAKMFAAGEVDGMFSGSGVAGVMIIKEIAVPVARPVDRDGHSTYWAVIVAPKGSPRFTGKAAYFRNKKILCTALASSGEFFFRSLPGNAAAKATVIRAASHGSALDGLTRHIADVAIVKNRVWNKQVAQYPGLELVGEDKGENPDSTLIMSSKAPTDLVQKVQSALLGIGADPSAEAAAVRGKMEIQGYIKTTGDDFKHTLELLKNAGVTSTFDFAF